MYTLIQSDVGGRRQVQTNDKVNREKVSIHARTHPSHALHMSLVLHSLRYHNEVARKFLIAHVTNIRCDDPPHNNWG